MGEKGALQTSASWQWSRSEPSFLPQSAPFPLRGDQVPDLGVAPVPLMLRFTAAYPLVHVCWYFG